MLKFVTALAVFVVLMALVAVLALLMGSAFSAVTQSQWWKRSAIGSGAGTGPHGSEVHMASKAISEKPHSATPMMEPVTAVTVAA